MIVKHRKREYFEGEENSSAFFLLCEATSDEKVDFRYTVGYKHGLAREVDCLLEVPASRGGTRGGSSHLCTRYRIAGRGGRKSGSTLMRSLEGLKEK